MNQVACDQCEMWITCGKALHAVYRILMWKLKGIK